jgi:hypothetical protein
MLIRRDPFPREELHRKQEATPHSCDWCGSRRSNGKLWAYEVQPDCVVFRAYPLKGLFCSASCFRAYRN